jgi:hypothetical protein
VGVEWELQIVDRETRELVPAAPELIEELRGHDGQPHPKVKPELLQCEIELITGMLYPHSSLPESQLRELVTGMPAHERQRVARAYVGDRGNRRHKPGRALERIWYRTWVYVGHETEIRQPGDSCAGRR